MGFMDKMKQAKDMYGNMKKIQQELDKIQVEGFSKSKHVTVTVKDMDLREVEKQILYACNDAMSKVEKEIKSKMGNMMNMPGGFKLPF